MQPITDTDRALYEWQIWTRGFGEAGQARLKNACALVSRVGGLGGPVALELAAAGIGKLILAHGGTLLHSDLNRQILMARADLGRPRLESAVPRLKALNPDVEIEAVQENMSEENAERLVARADIVFDCAPLFEERFAMNRACVRLGKPLVDAAMFDMEAQVTVILPGQTPCLACLYPELPPGWKRQFPVFGAIAGMAGCLAAAEGIKVLSGMGPSLAGKLLYVDARSMKIRTLPLARRADCVVCAGVESGR